MQVQNQEEFLEMIAEDVVTIVDYFAVWCGPCRMMQQIFEEAQAKFTDVKFAKVDIDQLTELSIMQNVQVVPTFVAYKNGKEINRLIGYNNQTEFDNFVTVSKNI